MTITKAKQLLPKFIGLESTYSRYYDTIIEEVFISFQDPQLARFKYTATKHFIGFPYLPSDVDNQTLIAALSNGKLVSVKSIVQFDNLEAYKKDAELLDEMYQFS